MWDVFLPMEPSDNEAKDQGLATLVLCFLIGHCFALLQPTDPDRSKQKTSVSSVLVPLSMEFSNGKVHIRALAIFDEVKVWSTEKGDRHWLPVPGLCAPLWEKLGCCGQSGFPDDQSTREVGVVGRGDRQGGLMERGGAVKGDRFNDRYTAGTV
ncbi:hypothetical protein RRG08_051664 [Elysia crispata]|uniref:Uncharacterized protein n=1 Tax=Elysia crispata TaxID=231223 RepID=A0AAE1A3V2_9GAST|nr:hypothetical protein RRG08_051664 [Elysia crispata]